MSQTTPATTSPHLDPSLLPVVVIGAGPVGLAAAAHLTERSMPFIVLEAGDHAGSAMADWSHIRTFTPWQYIVDAAAERLLAPTGWTRPAQRQSPTGGEIVQHYLQPLAAVLADEVQTRSRVLAVSREGLDRSRTRGRAERVFIVRVQRADGTVEDLRARAVIDASGTWGHSNPLGASGLPALGEREAAEHGFLVGPLPDVLGAHRERFAGRATLVVGMGHSAANTLVALAQLAREVPGTRIVWAIRGQSARRVFGGGTADQLPDRGRLGSDLADLVTTGALEHVTGFSTRGLRIAPDGQAVTVIGDTPDGIREIPGVHNVAAATGFRPDVAMLSELRLDLDLGLQSPRELGPLIDPESHSCGTVRPHGWRELAHGAEPGFFVVGMKSYGRAPTFLITTGNEQVRSIVAHLAGDDAAANEVQLVLPETGVCSSSNALTDEQLANGDSPDGACCGAPEVAPLQLTTLRLGFATGVPNGRAGEAAEPREILPLAEVSSDKSPACCG